FFFRAEDGIRDRYVTGVQTCALPILLLKLTIEELIEINDFYNSATEIRIVYITVNLVLLELYADGQTDEFILSKRDLIMVLRNRSEERRVGKECRYRMGRDQYR